ncbi:MAG: FkbM family methyltransferase [Bacteroidetes bacterium]|nr:FkbM family methyltransferase [Bacteroidota bacterium]
MIDHILQRNEFQNNPPVLVDIGASGEIHHKWKKIAKYAICIAFDADDREMNFTENISSGFKKLITINRIVTDRIDGEVDFFLTQSPFCSSTLEPDLGKLSKWPFQNLFTVEKKIKLKAVQLVDALKNAGINGIDWLKIDTQGTDLRLFKSLPEIIRNNTLIAEFEPGIIDAYKGEDKLYEVIGFMSKSGFYMSSIDIKGVQRIDQNTIAQFSRLQQRAFRGSHKISPGWGEVCYMNSMENEIMDKRSYLLAYVFALIEKQYGFALEIAEKGAKKTGDVFFNDLKNHALKRISNIQFKWPFFAVKNKLDKVFDAIFR